MPKTPEMIGAHVPKKPFTRSRRCPLCQAAAEFNRAYNERFITKRTHLVYQPDLVGSRKV